MGISRTVPGSVGTDGNLLILATPLSALPNYPEVTLPELESDAAKDVTYSLTTTGFNNGITEESVTDERLTLAAVLAQPGRVTETLELQYVYGTLADVADKLFKRGEDYVISVRRAIAHNEALAAAQLFDHLVVKAGVKRPDPETANGKFTKTQGFYPQDESQRDVPLAATAG